jgi:uncharacterized protein YjbJ (UPF0337 family)
MILIQIIFEKFAEHTIMTNMTPSKPIADANKQAVLKDIHAKWGKFSDTDLAALKGKDDLVTQVVSKYGQEKSLVQREVDTLLKGRAI